MRIIEHSREETVWELQAAYSSTFFYSILSCSQVSVTQKEGEERRINVKISIIKNI